MDPSPVIFSAIYIHIMIKQQPPPKIMIVVTPTTNIEFVFHRDKCPISDFIGGLSLEVETVKRYKKITRSRVTYAAAAVFTCNDVECAKMSVFRLGAHWH